MAPSRGPGADDAPGADDPGRTCGPAGRTADGCRVGQDEPVANRDRLLPLVGACNFRDLGGYPTVDGRVTRWGRLFRSDTLHELTDDDLDVLQDLGLAAVIDLRTATEVERTGRGPLGTRSVTYLHAPVLPEEGDDTRGAPEPEGDDTAARYLWYLEVGRGPLVEAIEMVADEDCLPLVFHCTAGKDRTGVLAALVLDIVGVQHEVIVDDYVLTRTRMDLILSRLRRDPVHGPRIGEIPASRFRVDAATMRHFLDGLQARHGGAREWALHAGVRAESLARLAGALLERDACS